MIEVLVKKGLQAILGNNKKKEISYFETLDTAIIPDHVFEELNFLVKDKSVDGSIARIRYAMRLANRIGELNGEFSEFINNELQQIEEEVYGPAPQPEPIQQAQRSVIYQAVPRQRRHQSA